MKTKIIFTTITLLMYAFCANAETCTTTSTSTPAGPIPSYARDLIQYCSSVTYKNYYYGSTATGTAIYSTPQCTTCKNGYTLMTFDNNGEANWTATCESYNPTFTICATPCNSACTSDEDYEEERDGVESLVNRTCYLDYKVCKSKTNYRCRSGYYGTAVDYKTGCTNCPYPQNDAHHLANSKPGNSTSIADCFISKSSSYNYFYDTTGTYKCTEDAYYKL